jgi:5''-nucleotidase/2'',3''-cyclic phosphodiesterase and related esterases
LNSLLTNNPEKVSAMISSKYIIPLFFLLGLLSGCKTTYSVKNITCEQIPIDATLDTALNPQLQQFIQQYKDQIDSVMNQQIGVAALTLTAGKPQSLLANFTADILRQAGAEYTDDPVSLALMNNGGLRSPINKGPITVGDIFKVFPFENELVVLKMKGPT